MAADTDGRPGVEQVLRWLGEVPDPEVPVLSVVDLGIVREVRWDGQELCVAISPTYSGCPATEVIARDIESALRARGIQKPRLERRLFPPWSSDWISGAGREKLRAFGIAPPVGRADEPGPGHRARARPPVPCPRCAGTDTERISEFGSTPCKAQYRCRACLEPFDYFKCI